MVRAQIEVVYWSSEYQQAQIDAHGAIFYLYYAYGRIASYESCCERSKTSQMLKLTVSLCQGSTM